jgi:hypothetical protein
MCEFSISVYSQCQLMNSLYRWHNNIRSVASSLYCGLVDCDVVLPVVDGHRFGGIQFCLAAAEPASETSSILCIP